MTNDSTTTLSTSTIFDGWRSISIPLYMALVGYSVMVSVPVLRAYPITPAAFSVMTAQARWSMAS